MDSASHVGALARTALNLALLGNEPMLRTLRGQAAVAEWTITLTGCGFRVAFRLPQGVLLVDGEPSFEITDVYGEFADTEHVVTFELFVRSGMILMLEGSFTGPSWPEDASGMFLLYNTETGIRDLGSFMAGLRSSMRYPEA